MKTVRDAAQEELDELKRRLEERGGPINHTDLLDHNRQSILIRAMLEEMFEESDMWLVSEFPTVRQVGL